MSDPKLVATTIRIIPSEGPLPEGIVHIQEIIPRMSDDSVELGGEMSYHIPECIVFVKPDKDTGEICYVILAGPLENL